MTLIRWRPFMDPFEDADKFFEEGISGMSLKGFVPALDIYEKDGDLMVETLLPGISPDDVKVTVENDVLTIEGESRKKSEVDEKNYYRKEVRYGSFHRSVALPISVDGDKAEAMYENGVLKVRIPKATKTILKTIKVNVKK